jgi:hypothetical protein
MENLTSIGGLSFNTMLCDQQNRLPPFAQPVVKLVGRICLQRNDGPLGLGLSSVARNQLSM